MIPKIIHYCWFGNNPIPKLEKKCMESWSKYCPEYEIMTWTEETFDLSTAPLYVQQAYDSKKWAFVSDYVRFYALNRFGGIYLDTDVELLTSLNQFLYQQAFSGTEDGEHISAGIMGCEKDFELFKTFEKYYYAASFLNCDGSLNTTTVVEMITSTCMALGYLPNNTIQTFSCFTIYPSDYFYPLSIIDGVMRKTRNTVAIHWFAASWVSEKERKEAKIARRNRRIKEIVKRIFGEDVIKKVKVKRKN